VNPGLSIDELRRSSKFKRAVLEEFSITEQPIKLKQMIRKYVELLGGIQEVFRETTKTIASDAQSLVEQTLREYASEFPSEEGLFLVAVAVDDNDQAASDLLNISTAQGEYLDRLRRRTHLVNYSMRRLDY
jgi:hypothetical protein